METIETNEILTIQQMAQLSGLSAHTLRYYERAGLMPRHVGRKAGNGYRYYTQRDVNWLHFIKCLRATGMPIRDIQCYTQLMAHGESTTEARMQLLQQHRSRVEEHLHEVQQHLAAINKKITLYEEVYTKKEQILAL